ncbi:electron transport complex subunit RsxC [Candidatus Woesearchaeota archaeon]|nr:electron transport complex subunit RsxC [Candidatus Woesearchaeota archaeon]
MSGFRGGIHPDGKKELAANKEIQTAEMPKKVTILLKQHAGCVAKPTVNIGDHVKTGQLIATVDGLGANIHSSITGRVAEIKEIETNVCGNVPAITIEHHGGDEWQLLEEKQPLEMIKDAGIVGMGGAMFPTHVKLCIPEGKKVDTLLVNGAECEPYLTCDYRLMLEKPKEIMEGIRIVKGILGVKKTMIAIEDNKKDVAEGFKDVEVKILKTKYPQGAEKTLIKAALRREVPPERLPFDAGVVVCNVGTIYAIQQAVKEKKPSVERIVTVSGAVNEPKNLLVRIGTPVKDIIRQCGGYKGKSARILNGGPMMGICIDEDDVVLKGSSGITVMNDKMVEEIEEQPCIRCAECINVCPMKLMPKLFADYSRAKKYSELKSLNIVDCFECGACTYVCPANIPLVEYIKEGKKRCKK